MNANKFYESKIKTPPQWNIITLNRVTLTTEFKDEYKYIIILMQYNNIII